MNTLLQMGLSNALLACLLAVLAAVVGAVCRRPALTHSLWLLVLLKLVTPPLLPLPILWPASAELPDSADSSLAREPATLPATPVEPGMPEIVDEFPPGEDEEQVPLPVPDPSWNVEPARQEPSEPSPALLLASLRDLALPLWLLGAVVWFAWTGWNIFCFQRLLRFARRAPRALQQEADELAQRMGLKRYSNVWLVPGAVSPMVWAVGGPARLLFPARLLERLDRDQRATLLAHELAHLRRRDHWVRWLELLVLGLYWWHPVAWWARRELHEAEEQCCDAWVLWAVDGASRPYALALLQTVAFFSHGRSTLPVAASGIGQVPHLRRRLTMIMQGTTPRSLSWAGCCGVLALALFLPVLPVQAQTPVPPKDTKDARDEQIDTLKRAIKILEEQKRGDKGKEDAPKADPADLKKAQAELMDLARTVRVKQAELQMLEAKLNEAMARIKMMGGTPTSLDVKDPTAPKVTYAYALPVQQKLAEARLAEAQARLKTRATEVIQDRSSEDAKAKIEARVTQKRSADLEQRLDRLLKEIEALKQEIHRPTTYYIPATESLPTPAYYGVTEARPVTEYYRVPAAAIPYQVPSATYSTIAPVPAPKGVPALTPSPASTAPATAPVPPNPTILLPKAATPRIREAETPSEPPTPVAPASPAPAAKRPGN